MIDDGSTDGTAEMVRAEFPAVRLVRHDRSRGLVVRRNEGVRLASGPVVFSIDDDAAFSTDRVVRQTLDAFDDDVVGAVAIPCLDLRTDARPCPTAPPPGGAWVTDRYKGTAHAVRRDVFLALGGYREAIVHQGEEGDYCLRLLAAGLVVRLGAGDPIHHFESPRRDLSRMDYYGTRNAVQFVWRNVPMPDALVRLPGVVVRCLLLTWTPGRLRWRVAGLFAGLVQCATTAREPVARPIYRLARLLAAAPVPLEAIRSRLPPRREAAS